MIKSSKGVVSQLYGLWLWEGTTNGITFSNLEISDNQQRQVVEGPEVFNADKSNLQRHAYLVNEPVELENMESIVCRDNKEKIAQIKSEKITLKAFLHLWDRQSIDLIVAAEMNKRKSISNLNLHGLEDEITVWLQLAPGKINPYNDPKSPESDERHETELIEDGLIIDLTDYNPLAKVKKAGQEVGLNKPPSSITILAWNCRGLRRKETINVLRGLVKKWKPSCLFLAETKCKSSGLLKLCKSLRFDHLEVVESIGLFGGLVLMWIKGIDIEIVLQDANVISFSISGSNGLPNWKGQACYSPTQYKAKKNF
ncbi:hypothetical protein FNV43_RR02645 [Rhamnella rubrinervis]|uniref:Uncharacterized protein n=1 Tax=Rhamnella rubrinervis TaxID=2594499 RepID=A0A8K0HTA3_9ROSA|nr:hypothetical protein FNV43_RR02645 [Rhamnella rubrinervis]